MDLDILKRKKKKNREGQPEKGEQIGVYIPAHDIVHLLVLRDHDINISRVCQDAIRNVAQHIRGRNG